MTTDTEAKRIRKRVMLGFARITVLISIVVVVFRIAVPYLFDLHTDLGLLGAVGVGLFGLGALIWLGLDIGASILRRRSRPHIVTSIRRPGRP